MTLRIGGAVVALVILIGVVALVAGFGDEPAQDKASWPSPRTPEVPRTAQPAETVKAKQPEVSDVQSSASQSSHVSAESPTPPKDKSGYNPRASVAASLLAAAKDYREKNPGDPWGYKDLLEEVLRRYARTPGAEEAARLLAAWKAPKVDLPLAKLVAFWPFDEGAGETTRDFSGKGHDGKLIGNPQWTTGRKGKALRFTGKENVLIARSEDFDLGESDYTIAAWVKTTRGGAILCKTNPNGKWERDGKSFFIQNGAPVLASSHIGYVRGLIRVADGEWHHVAVVFKANDRNVSLYANGQRAGQRQLRVRADPQHMFVRLGTGFSHPFEGSLDEVCVFRHSLSQGQVRLIMEKGLGDLPPPLSVAAVESAPVVAKVKADETKSNGNDRVANEPHKAQRHKGAGKGVVDEHAGPGSVASASVPSKAAPGCAIYEPFDYPADKALGGVVSTSDMGFEGPWKSRGKIASKEMTWGSLPTLGNCVAPPGNAESHRTISKRALHGAGLLDDGATLWMSFLMSVERANLTNVDMNLALASQPFTLYTGHDKYRIRMELEGIGNGVGVAYVNKSVRACVWISGKRRPAEKSRQEFDAGANALALIAAKITWGRGGDADTIEVYVPDKNLDPGPVVSKTTADLDQKTFTFLGLQMKEPHTHVDEIRMGATYADVTSDTIAKVLNGLRVEDVVGTVERDGYRISLGIMKNLSVRFDAAKVTAKKVATVGDVIAASSSFDASLKRSLSIRDGYAFAGRMGLVSSSTNIKAALRSVPRALARQRPEVVRVCIGLADIARNLPPGDFRTGLKDLVDAILDAGAVPVLHTLPMKTIDLPKDKQKREDADRMTKALYALSESVSAFNAAITAVAAEKEVPLVDAWHVVNAGADAHQKYFVMQSLKREGYEAINERFLKLYRILECGIAGRSAADTLRVKDAKAPEKLEDLLPAQR